VKPLHCSLFDVGCSMLFESVDTGYQMFVTGCVGVVEQECVCVDVLMC
jgi:hypothetical protein